MKTGNTEYLRFIGPYLIEGMYAPAPNGLEVFDPMFDEFEQQLTSYTPEEQDLFKDELCKLLKILINNADKIELNEIFEKATMYYLPSDEVVKEFLIRLYQRFIETDDYLDPDWSGDFELIQDPIDF